MASFDPTRSLLWLPYTSISTARAHHKICASSKVFYPESPRYCVQSNCCPSGRQGQGSLADIWWRAVSHVWHRFQGEKVMWMKRQWIMKLCREINMDVEDLPRLDVDVQDDHGKCVESNPARSSSIASWAAHPSSSPRALHLAQAQPWPFVYPKPLRYCDGWNVCWPRNPKISREQHVDFPTCKWIWFVSEI